MDARGTERPAVVVAITGASGAVFGVRAVELLTADPQVDCHVVVSRSGAMTLRSECGLSERDVHRMADVAHRPADVGATIASGSYPVTAMIVAPCSVRTLGAIAYTQSTDLVTRAADVCLKEGRPLVLMLRETPLHLGHLRAMTAATEAGAVIAPPVPAFYTAPETIADLVDHSVRRALARAGLARHAPRAWPGLSGAPPEHRRTDG